MRNEPTNANDLNQGAETMGTETESDEAIIWTGARSVRKHIRAAKTLAVYSVLDMEVTVHKNQFLSMGDEELSRYAAYVFSDGFVRIENNTD